MSDRKQQTLQTFLLIIGSRGDMMLEIIYTHLKTKQFGLLILTSLLLFFVHQQVGYSQVDNPIPITPEKMITTIFQGSDIGHQFSQISQVSVQELSQTHQLITFRDGLQQGYIVLSKQDEQEQMIEFGYGTSIPYQTSIIFDQDIKKHEPDGFQYISPLESFWEFNYGSETVYMDGSSGEWLPDLKKSLEPIKQKAIEVTNSYYTFKERSTDSYQIISGAIFNPNSDLSWLVPTPKLSLSKEETIAAIKKEQVLMVTGTKMDGLVTFAYPITGFQQWDNYLYLSIYDEILDMNRYILYEDLLQYGVIVQK